MMRPRLTDLILEVDKFRSEKTALEQLSMKMLTHEAAMRVIAKHNLWEDLAKELQTIG